MLKNADESKKEQTNHDYFRFVKELVNRSNVAIMAN